MSQAAAIAPTAPQEDAADLQEMLRELHERLQAVTQRLSEPQINAVYSAAYHLLQQGRADRAVRLFGMLTALRPERARYWHAVGICRRRLNEHAEAALAFGRGFECDPTLLECGLMQGEALLLMGHKAEGVALLDRIDGMAREKGDAAAMLRAEGLRALVGEASP